MLCFREVPLWNHWGIDNWQTCIAWAQWANEWAADTTVKSSVRYGSGSIIPDHLDILML